MNRIQLILFFLFFSGFACAQESWNPQIIKKANTAALADYMSKKEKEVVYYTNLVRLDPKGFSKIIAKRYIDSAAEKNSYTSSLLKTLATMTPVSALEPEEALFLIAKQHALNYGKLGKTGHDDLKKRFEKYIQQCRCRISENTDYGYGEALDIVMDLLIDMDIPDFGHRKNMLDPNLKKIGVSIQPHKIYEWNCVIDLSE